MLASFYTGLSGLSTHSLAMNNIGNNIANINTIGFKSTVARFETLISQSAIGLSSGGNLLQIGLGTQLGQIQGNFSQGGLTPTGIQTNAAIQGAGFFVLEDPTGTDRVYTRAGDFGLNQEGFLINAAGYFVQGWLPGSDGRIDTNQNVGAIQIPPGIQSAANATDMASLIMNLDASVEEGYEYTTTIIIYDTLGNEHAAVVTFEYDGFEDYIDEFGDPVSRKTWTVTWEIDGMDPGLEDFTIAFDENGNIWNIDGVNVWIENPAGVEPDLIINPDLEMPVLNFGNPGNGAADIEFTWMILKDLETGRSNITQYAGPSATSSTNQDGYGSGTLLDISIDPDGMVLGTFSNGRTLNLAQLGLANFNNPDGLFRIQGNMFTATTVSGQQTIGVANTGGRGQITGGNIELSNVDLAREFTTMIINERGYQANSRVITTSDDMSREAINLKR